MQNTNPGELDFSKAPFGEKSSICRKVAGMIAAKGRRIASLDDALAT
jgi:hypothetical protein